MDTKNRLTETGVRTYLSTPFGVQEYVRTREPVDNLIKAYLADKIIYHFKLSDKH